MKTQQMPELLPASDSTKKDSKVMPKGMNLPEKSAVDSTQAPGNKPATGSSVEGNKRNSLPETPPKETSNTKGLPRKE